MGDETKIVVRNLSPEAWEALKWALIEKFRSIQLKDENNDGHYETGEAQQIQSGKMGPLSGPQLIEFEKAVANYNYQDLEIFERDQKALQAILEGRCHQRFQCSAEELKTHAKHFLEGEGKDHLSFYASLLQEKFKPQEARPDIALMVGEALFAKGDSKAARPFFERAKVIVNDSRIQERLASIDSGAKDLKKESPKADKKGEQAPNAKTGDRSAPKRKAAAKGTSGWGF